MNILIIGGTKFIGPHVAQQLHQEGHQVTLFHRGETRYSFTFKPNVIYGDRSRLSSFRKQFAALALDTVIDMIPYSERDAKQLLDVFNYIAKRIVIVSSCDVYKAYDRLWNVVTGDILTMPLTENARLREQLYPLRKIMNAAVGDWSYDYDKIIVENTIRECKTINSTVLRLPMVYGPGDDTRIYPYLKRMDNEKTILLNKDKASWTFSRGYVEDMAHAIVLAALDNRMGNYIYNIAETTAYTEIEWIELIGQMSGWKNKIITVPASELPSDLKDPPLAWEQDLIIDSTLARTELNYHELYSHADAMKKSIAWLRANKNSADEETHLVYQTED